MNKQIIAKRVRLVRQLLNKKKINCFLTTNQANVTYITGFLGHDSWALIAPDNVYLLTDSRYIEQAQKECPICKIIQRKTTLHDSFADLIKKQKNVRSITVENSILIKDYNELQKKTKIRFRTVSKIFEPGRSIKDKFELAAIKKAIQITKLALKETIRNLRVGISENEAAGMMDYNFRKFGGRNGFDTILAFGANASRCHHQPGTGKLRKNDTILIDFGAEYNHYRCDLTRCFLVGQPNQYFQKVYNVVKEAQAAAIKLIRPGMSNKEPERVAREIIRKHNLPPYQHGSGHGFGLVIHEDPFLSVLSKDKLKKGMVLTIEPGIYIPDKIGVRLEDNVLITENGCKILTSSVTKNYKDICLGKLK